jgi:predicted cobalt transporter CbtA
MVPPVPAPAMSTSTLPELGWEVVEGVDLTASIISGPVVNSCAFGLFTYVVFSWV